ncbi:MAG: carboxypeptidase-like regulatory domain-containing protein [Blastocatellia bacterium]|nr:carboxypeptidase-like regulatory domain-containing protein [Blastocatellia bacterium]
MKRQLTILDRVSVKSPCHEDWNEMKGNDTVRFCSHCCKSVHNLSEMTRSEAIKLVEQSKSRLCIRYVEGPNQSIITKPDPYQPAFQFGRLGSLATGVFSLAAGMAVLATPLPVSGQQVPETLQVQASQSTQMTKSRSDGRASISGTVTDMTGAVLAGGDVKLVDVVTGEVRTTTTDANGRYSLEVKPGCIYQIEISVSGFNTWGGKIQTQPGIEIVLETKLGETHPGQTIAGEMTTQIPTCSQMALKSVEVKIGVLDLPLRKAVSKKAKPFKQTTKTRKK